ncbi:hypothetical protein ACEZDB_32260 [Streptacidiphilus sp. N1-3]|uniref:Uncharacterized protein n=1 Tax=Streptacidiphilus alkalitolerans TaxID=3342712 RepID=A0ABV6XAS4_9ACTN
MAFGTDVKMDSRTVLRPVYDPRLCCFSIQLWTDGEPGGIHGLVEHFAHPDELLETTNAFLESEGVRCVTDEEYSALRRSVYEAQDGWAFGTPVSMDERTQLRPAYDPQQYTFSIQLWTDGEPGGIHGLVERFAHPDDLLGTLDAFLETKGVRHINEGEYGALCRSVYEAKGGPDWAIIVLLETGLLGIPETDEDGLEIEHEDDEEECEE